LAIICLQKEKRPLRNSNIDPDDRIILALDGRGMRGILTIQLFNDLLVTFLEMLQE
jgi:hypothetical protein